MKKILVIEMELGEDDYLTKLCTVEELLRAIAARLEKQATLRLWCTAESQPVSAASPADTAKPATPQSISTTCPQLNEVFDFIEANYRQPISLRDVAKAVRYSPAYLTDLVRRRTGRSVHHWIVERRLAEARCLLLETNQTVNQIAGAVGYQDSSHFTRLFRQIHKMPPNAWRNAQRIQSGTI